ncbi:VOC family protein [Actinophytocola oryzae]|uniref:Catechol 2,3-dioxygenase-like lactoylglutathione lyase family enzyme n=1 Tax=Actinophytocola oryzae TaxID=502181 RepID=A0A4R7VD01_9PSEU|nr:VOC family protein [Actinophytocola oryzae]TDV46849.1 catechol 2,3-dioxygenase-like lactoylglutathione lyase family enzyme [Actinophytocola oryzae]
MTDAVITGIHHVKFPVRDIATSIDWYERVFGFTFELEFPDEDGVVRGVAGTIPGLGDAGIALRENPRAAEGFAGFDPVSFGIADREAAEAWVIRLDELGVEHSPVINASIGWIVSFHDPDGTEIRLYSFAAHGLDTSGLAGHARPRA